MTPAISVQNLGKSYRVSHQAAPRGYRTLRESLTGLAAAPLRRFRNVGTDGASSEEFWALKDVSFEVRPGEIVGIIGRNGAGKSTLLKILSRIAKPSRGNITVRGRVGSLLEVGTGFHPELTGRENIYLNGSILGMSRAEIEGRFDEIVEFSGVSRFIDTPVKRYSSGMQVRLAFAVAAHLEPEVLLLDEVLAVGDIAFQNKCLARMHDVTQSGRTIIFVSHNMAAVQSLCTRAILLSSGTIAASGPVDLVVASFMGSISSGVRSAADGIIALDDHPNRRTSSKQILKRLSFVGEGPIPQAEIGGCLEVEIRLRIPRHAPALSCVLFICKPDGDRLLMSHSRIHSKIELTGSGEATLLCTFPELSLLPGTYRIDLAVASSDEVYDYIEHVTDLSISGCDYLKTGELPSAGQGVIAARSTWGMISDE